MKLKKKLKDRTRFFLNKTLEWIEKNGNELSRLHLLGGETFYQSELQEVLDTLKKLKNKNLELNIVSNCMVKEDIFKSYIEQIKKLCKDRNIGRFDLTASIDGWGKEAEYCRTGLDCAHFEKLLSYAVHEKWIHLHTNTTLTTMTVRTMPLLIEKIKKFRRINKKISIRFGFVVGKPYLHPKIYGYNFWKDDFQKIIKVMPNDTEMDKKIKDFFKGSFNSIIEKDPQEKLIKNFKFYLDQLDKRRNTNWRKIFPYLDI